MTEPPKKNNSEEPQKARERAPETPEGEYAHELEEFPIPASSSEGPAAEASESSAKTQALEQDLKVKLEEIEGLRQSVREYEQKIAGIRDYVKRMESETKEMKSRLEKDFQDKLKHRLAGSLLPFVNLVDLLEKSLETAPNDPQSVTQGLEMILKQLQEDLRRVGVEKGSAQGEDFQPEFYEAISIRPVQDKALDGKVVEEYHAAYFVEGRLIRPGKVVVGKFE